jgi:hypothetical protein
MAQPGADLYGIEHSNNDKVILIGGGPPVVQNGMVIGAVGASAGTVAQDVVVAEAALSAVVPLLLDTAPAAGSFSAGANMDSTYTLTFEPPTVEDYCGLRTVAGLSPRKCRRREDRPAQHRCGTGGETRRRCRGNGAGGRRRAVLSDRRHCR